MMTPSSTAVPLPISLQTHRILSSSETQADNKAKFRELVEDEDEIVEHDD